MKIPVFQVLADAARKGERVALGILIGAKGSSPQKVGAKAVFAGKGIHGTLGGGCLEAEAQRLAARALKTGRAETFELVLDHDFGWDDGLICGGKVAGVILPDAQSIGETFWRELGERKETLTWGVRSDFSIGRLRASESAEGWLYVETVSPPCALWIAGSGHIAQAVAPLAHQLDFAVTIFDDRPELANPALFPEAAALHVGDWSELIKVPFPTVPTFGLIVTRGHKHDALVLESWIHQPFVFLGMIGSRRKARTITDHFVRQQIATREQVERVACPVGVPIRSQSVTEIAVSILAQYIDQRGMLDEQRKVVSAAKNELRGGR